MLSRPAAAGTFADVARAAKAWHPAGRGLV
jgi:hypothetical protein